MNNLKNHFVELFDSSHIRMTIIFVISGLLLIIGSQVIGTTDNLPGLTLLFTGVILLFFSVLHPWRKTKNYSILAGFCIGITVLVFLAIYILSSLHLNQYISEAFVMITVLLICLPGFVVSIIGILICSGRKK